MTCAREQDHKWSQQPAVLQLILDLRQGRKSHWWSVKGVGESRAGHSLGLGRRKTETSFLHTGGSRLVHTFAAQSRSAGTG